MKKTNISDIIVVGGNDAGLSAAGRAKRLNQNLNILVLEQTPHVGYASCALPNMIGGTVAPEPLAGSAPEQIAGKRGFDIRINTRVTEINTLKHTLLIENLVNGEKEELGFKKLLLTTGADPIIPVEFNDTDKNVFTLRNFKDAQNIYDYINTSKPKKALIVGGGYIGIEMAEALHNRGIHISVIEQQERLLTKFNTDISQIIEQKLQQSDIQLYLSCNISSCERRHSNIQQVSLNTGTTLDCDMIILAAGVRPATDIAQKAGIPLGKSGAVTVNDYMQTRRLDVYAAGDCVETKNLVTGRPSWLPLAGIASRQGRIAGSNLAGKRASYPGALGTFMVKAFGVEFASTGLDLQGALKSGIKAAETIIVQNSKPGYMPGTTPITLALVYEEKTYRILGGQIVGAFDAGHRINILAAAITGGLDARDLEYMDLGYTPLINNMWDPISIGGNAAQK